MSEQAHQEALFEIIALHIDRYPALALAVHYPAEGMHHISYRRKMRLQGVKAGLPDCLLFARRGVYCGWAAELKVAPNKPTAAQKWWLAELAANGWQVGIFYHWQAAWESLLAYVGVG